MLGGGAGSPGGDELLTVTVVRDEHGYGMKVSGDNPVYVQSVKEHGAAWRAGLRAGDRILRVDTLPVHHHTHQEVVHMIRANPTTVLTVQQNSSRLKTPITAPVPVNPEKQRQLEVSKAHTVRLMLEKQQKYVRELRSELLKVPDLRTQAKLESAEQRCAILQHEIDTITAGQTDNRGNVPVLHVRSQSSPEHLDHDLSKVAGAGGPGCGGGGGVPGVPGVPLPEDKAAWERGTPPPGTPPPPYAHNTQPCADPQRAIISMEEDDSPASDNSSHWGLFSNLRSVRESNARTAVLLNWLLGERRCACASLLLVLTDGYRAAAGVTTPTLRRWAYEIHSTFLIPNAVLQLSGVDENMANEIEHVLVNEYDKEELLRNVFRKARQKAKEEMAQQLTEFQVKRQVGLGTMYGPEDAVLESCQVDKAQEQVVVERLLCQQLGALAAGGGAAPAGGALLAALIAAALSLHCRPAAVAAAVGGARGSFLQRDKLYKQRAKQLAKQHPQPFVVRGHHLQLQALTSVGHCHHCDNVIWGLAPQAYVCTDCKLRVHRACARAVEEGCCLDGDHHSNRISRFMERIHQPNSQDSSEKKSRKSSGTGHFLNMERSFRKMEDEQPWDQTLTPTTQGEPRREGSTDEPSAPDADLDTSDTVAKEQPDKDNNWRTSSASNARGVNRAESCRERDAPRRGKHRNASDPNRLTAHNNHDLEPGAATAPSGSSSSSSLSSRSNESNTVADQQASQSDWSEEDEPLAAQWADSLPPSVLDALLLSARMRKRQEVIHELIVSEGSHVRWLKVLGGVFLRPLEAAPALLPPDELRALLPNLPGVRERHARLYGELRTARNEAPNHIVQIRPVATAMLNTLGEAGYSPCLARFCRGQRMALDALKERRRKSKELHQFLFSREQLPLCGRLQLRDLLACVWQRLTKYQLLLEGILKTVSETDCEEDGDSEDDVVQLRRALDIAKDVLQNVDTAICTAENEHRLRTIQSKLEVRIPLAGSEWDEPRRLDLTHHALRMEGELSIRNDSNKKMSVLALMLDDSLVLLQREGDKFILKPIPQPSQQGLLSPLIKWDKVLFRPNAATRNAFFLMNINGVQMHELSTKTTTEYTSWVKHMAELPLAKPELRPSLAPLVPLAPLAPLTPLTPLAPAHAPSKSNDDSGINVSRNPSDASEKSNSTAPGDEAECERDRVSLSAERERDEKSSVEREERRSVDKEEASERDEKHKPRRPTVGRISTHGAAPLEPRAALGVAAPAAQELAHTALTALTHQERLRRLDEGISRALRAKSAVVSELLGVPSGSFAHVADLAVADSRRAADMPADADSADIHHLLLAAQAQANQLTEMLMRALTVNEAGAVAARAGRAGHCAACAAREPRLRGDNAELSTKLDDAMEAEAELKLSTSLVEQELLEHAAGLEPLGCGADVEDWSVGGAALATRLVGPASGVQGALAALLGALPALLAARAAGRRELAALRDRADALRARRPPGYPLTEEISYPNEGLDQSIQDQPSNGG